MRPVDTACGDRRPGETGRGSDRVVLRLVLMMLLSPFYVNYLRSHVHAHRIVRGRRASWSSGGSASPSAPAGLASLLVTSPTGAAEVIGHPTRASGCVCFTSGGTRGPQSRGTPRESLKNRTPLTLSSLSVSRGSVFTFMRTSQAFRPHTVWLTATVCRGAKCHDVFFCPRPPLSTPSHTYTGTRTRHKNKRGQLALIERTV